jgi:hypothetical protein
MAREHFKFVRNYKAREHFKFVRNYKASLILLSFSLLMHVFSFPSHMHVKLLVHIVMLSHKIFVVVARTKLLGF